MCRFCDTTRVGGGAPKTVTLEDTIACRLPTNVTPTHYDVALAPNFETRKFDSHVDIDIEIKEATNTITLNSLDLDYHNDEAGKPRVYVKQSNNQSVQADRVELTKADERAIFHFSQSLPVGKATLSINYEGTLNDNMCGFYYSPYNLPNGKLSPLAVTQFEATDCRRAVPSWDEPAVKATFAVTLIVPPTHSAISNMPVKNFTRTGELQAESEENKRGLKYAADYHRYTYYTTPLMSTYLLAFVVGELEYVSAFTDRGLEVRVYAPIGSTHLTKFSLECSVRAMTFYEKLFDIDFPLPKVDLIACPLFAAGAMENWGCITFRDTALLIDPAHSSTAVKQRVALTVSHELAHSWFGNLVTMEWWTQLYLNEGFARFTEHFAVDHLFPEWRTWDDFVTGAQGQALSLDALESSHPIEIPVTHPDQINEIFDTISYAKGASIIRMLAFHIGSDVFFSALRKYLKKHAYGNAVSGDLWDAISAECGMDVTKFMATWTHEMGYPVITIDEVASSGSKRKFKLTQSRFLASGKADDRADRLWTVPIKIGIIENGEIKSSVTHVFDGASGEIEVEAPASAALKFNLNSTGFYRCQYSTPLFDQLVSVLNTLPASDRLNFQRDSFALAMAGRVPIAQALDVIETLVKSKEDNLAVIQSYTNGVSYLTNIHSEEPYFKNLQKWIVKLYEPALANIGWDAKASESSLASMERSLTIGQLGTAGYKPVVDEANRRLKAFVADAKANPLSGDLRGAVYSIACKNGGWNEREMLYKLYQESNSAEEKGRILSSIGLVDKDSSDRDRCIDANIEWAFKADSDVRANELGRIVASIAHTKAGREKLWAYLQSNWEPIYARYSKGQNFIMAGLLGSLLGQNKTTEAVEQWQTFFAANPVPSAERTLAQTAEAVTITAGRIQRDREELQKWLQAHTQ